MLLVDIQSKVEKVNLMINDVPTDQKYIKKKLYLTYKGNYDSLKTEQYVKKKFYYVLNSL